MAGLLTADLGAFLRDAARAPWRWGRNDCCMMAADWVRLSCGRDPAAAWRGAYDDEASCLALIEAAGGVERMVGDGMAASGLALTDAPARGDVGLVHPAGFPRPMGAICIGDLWALRLEERGMAYLPMQPLLAWSVAP